MSDLVRDVGRIIEERYLEPLSSDSIARMVGRRAEYVAARFRQETGLTIHQHLTHVRMREARRLLDEGHKVYSAAALVGYKSRKSFYQQFRRAYGMTPGAYARLSAPGS